ncbi:MAG TPA: hypothetical protein VH062_22960 [Polyangiaceae bacterium]|jgi:hypothetical protein|nr:hypothetical protein [Polyangiaceae bacterium]
MLKASALIAFTLLASTGCGASDHSTPSTPSKPSTPSSPSTPSTGDNTAPGAFNPPPVADGYQRLTATTIPTINPGDDVTYCQYVMAPVDSDMDVIDIGGFQSKFGHHAVAFSYTGDGTQELGKSTPCMGSEFSSGAGTSADSMMGGADLTSMGSFLGGVGGGSSDNNTGKLPDGVVFRLKKGDGIMLNAHYINTGTEVISGDAVIDVKLADADPTRLVASLFLNLNIGFNLPPQASTSSSSQCVAGDDVKILMMTNHMHEFGTSATTEVTRANGDNVMLHADPTWTYDMQFNPVYSRWTVAAPFVLNKGDTIKTTCTWDNTKPDSMVFPREMCIGVGFALTTGDSTHVPACAAGTWLSSFL